MSAPLLGFLSRSPRALAPWSPRVAVWVPRWAVFGSPVSWGEAFTARCFLRDGSPVVSGRDSLPPPPSKGAICDAHHGCFLLYFFQLNLFLIFLCRDWSFREQKHTKHSARSVAVCQGIGLGGAGSIKLNMARPQGGEGSELDLPGGLTSWHSLKCVLTKRSVKEQISR